MKKEYGYVYIETDADKKKYAPKLASDEYLSNYFGWTPVAGSGFPRLPNLGGFYNDWPYRRKIDPGEGYEIVPPEELETTAMEFTRDGVVWHDNFIFLSRRHVGWFVTADVVYGNDTIKAFRRKKVLPAGVYPFASFSLDPSLPRSCDGYGIAKPLPSSGMKYCVCTGELHHVDNCPRKKPPLGLRPAKLVAESRIIEILDAMKRYTEAGLSFPDDWFVELKDQIDIQQGHGYEG